VSDRFLNTTGEQQMKRQLARAQRGFTLIELMIVVAIIGILAAIAIPQYQDYVTRSRWSDNLTVVGPLKQAFGECYQNRPVAGVVGTAGLLAPCDTTVAMAAAAEGWLPTGTTDASFTGRYVTSVTTAGGVITITGNAQAGGCVVTLTPTPQVNQVQWVTANAAGGCTPARTGAGRT
jgi:type IV pilus assembly protein PilA